MTQNFVDADFSIFELIAEAALLHEALGKCGALNCDIRPVFAGAKVLGRALTVQCKPGDNLMLHMAIDSAKPGDVIVATVDGFLEGGAWGEVASIAAMERGVKGLVFDGSVRDVEYITRLNFPVFSKGISIKGTTKKMRGVLNQPIQIGGILVNPGDIVVGDSDGVVIIPVSEIESVVSKAYEIKAREDDMISKLKQGASTLDLLNLRSVIKELGMDSE